MSGLRKSTRLRKPITTIDQNLDDDDDAFITPKPKKSITRVSNKRPSTEDNDEQEKITPKKRQKQKSSTTKTSPYFNTKSPEKKTNSPSKETKKIIKPKGKKKTEKVNISIDENTTLSNDNTSVTTKTTTASDDNDSDSDSDDDGGWENVQSKPSEEVVIQKLLKEREEKQATVVNGEVEVSLTSDEFAAAQGKRKKNANSKEHQLELHLKRVLKQNFLQKHKDHIVCNLGHGFHIIKTYINNQELSSLMLSLLDESITKTLIYNNKSTNMNDIHRLMKYFNELFIIIDKPSNNEQENQSITLNKLRQAMSEHLTKSSSPIRVILFAIFVRLLQYECRLVFAADLPPIRPRAEKSEKLKIPHGSLIKTVKKNRQTLSDDDNSNSTTSEDTSRLHSHDHSSDLSRVVSSTSSEIIKNHRAISPPSTTDKSKIQTRRLMPRYYWIELFIETTNDGYIPIDIYTSKINSQVDFEVNIKFPMLYVWAFDTDLSSSYAKDVTKRYSEKWLTTPYRTSHIEHKTNGDKKWYEKLMKKYQPKDKKKSRLSQLENQQIENQLAKQPIPQSKSELTGHPLYVLKSKLLKFEGIYPNDTQPVGWLKEEPIYPRDNIHILRSKQTWLKEARQVNRDEEPYKIVDGRIKNMDRKMGVTTRPELELFGEWQTSDYIPPVAKDGIVPCNEYGNVDLFKPEMLPHGCVHIVEPNSARLCKKLGINYAEAITGFDAHGGGSHPVIEGIVVCKEYEQTLREAIEQQKQITIEKELKKIEDRVYKNWRKLIRGLIIKRNLAEKYADDDKDGGDLATDAKYQWPILPKDDDNDEENSM